MLLKKNINLGKVNIKLIVFILFISLFFSLNLNYADDLEGINTHIKVLDKISSKNILVKLKNGEDTKHKDLLIKSIKCKNSEFDDNPEVTAYMQVQDITLKNNDKVFVFNGWTFSSSPSISLFDHPVYDIWLVGCN